MDGKILAKEAIGNIHPGACMENYSEEAVECRECQLLDECREATLRHKQRTAAPAPVPDQHEDNKAPQTVANPADEQHDAPDKPVVQQPAEKPKVAVTDPVGKAETDKTPKQPDADEPNPQAQLTAGLGAMLDLIDTKETEKSLYRVWQKAGRKGQVKTVTINMLRESGRMKITVGQQAFIAEPLTSIEEADELVEGIKKLLKKA